MYLQIHEPCQDPLLVKLPLYLERCSAGFPSPAGDYVEQELDLNDYCIRHPSATFFIRATGNSMTELGLHDGDLLIVDRSESPRHGDIVIAEVDGGFTVKKLLIHPKLALQPMNSDYPLIYPDKDTLQIFGVVMHFVHSTRQK